MNFVPVTAFCRWHLSNAFSLNGNIWMSIKTSLFLRIRTTISQLWFWWRHELPQQFYVIPNLQLMTRSLAKKYTRIRLSFPGKSLMDKTDISWNYLSNWPVKLPVQQEVMTCANSGYLNVCHKLRESALFQTYSGMLQLIYSCSNYHINMLLMINTVIQWYMQYIHKWAAVTFALQRWSMWDKSKQGCIV